MSLWTVAAASRPKYLAPMETTDRTNSEGGTMLLNASIRTRLWIDDAIEYLQTGMRREDGQVAAEYLGLIVVIAVMIGILATSSIGDKLKSLILDELDKVKGGNGK
jgi:uncharacterized membrane-anchored protein